MLTLFNQYYRYICKVRMRFRSLIATIFGMCMCLALHGQDCVIAQDYEIADDSTVVASITIQGIAIDDLSDPLQGLCGVNLQFEHQAVGDIEIFIQSPAGQMVQLIGPAGQNTELTQLHSWDIGFVPCSALPMPDPFRNAIWTNLDNWFNFTDATGTYYPYDGCLEDLNTGPISGVWNIIITDAAEIYDGVIHEIELIFCDDTGISCEACEPFPGNLNVIAGTYCEADPALLFDAVTFPVDSTPDPFRYDYEYVIVASNIILDYLTVPDLRNLPPGNYEVCGLNILQASQIHKPEANGTTTYDDLLSIIDNNIACATVTDTCVQIEILTSPIPDNLNVVLCEGESFEYKGESYTEENTYFVSFGEAACDSITILNIRVVDVMAEITPSEVEFSCTTSEIILQSSFQEPLNGVTYAWTYENPAITIPNNTEDSVIVNLAGTYRLVMESEGCRDTVEITLDADGTIPMLSFNASVIDCNNPLSLINLESSVPATYIWDGPGLLPSEVNEEDPLVDMPGIYQVTVTEAAGVCVTIGNVEVLIDTLVEMPIINTVQFSCLTNNAMIDLEFVNPGNSVAWFYNSLEIGNTEDITVTELGQYTAIITAANGCTREVQVDIFEEFAGPVSNYLVDTLDCLVSIADIEHLAVELGHIYNWEGPSGPLGVGTSITTSDPGLYYVTVTSAAGCEKLDTFEIVRLDRIPDLVITGDSLGCSPDGGMLSVSSSLIIVSYDWFGPGGFDSNSANPTGIYPGIYIVDVVTDDGCMGEATFFMDHQSFVPNINLFPPPLDCDTDSGLVTITGGNPDLTYNWGGPGGFGSTIKEPTISDPGVYTVTVTDPNTGCVFFHDLVVEEVVAPAVIEFETSLITCDDDEAIIFYNSNTIITSSSWETVNGNIIEDKFDTLIVDQVGTYYVNTINEFGCVGRDSIVVTDDFDLPDLSVVASLVFLDCSAPIKQLRAISSNTDVRFEWEGPPTVNVDNIINPQVSEAGWYYVTAIRDNGCFDIDSVEVRMDTIPPVLNITVSQNGIATCVDSVVEVSSIVTFPGTFDFEWTGPGISTMDSNLELREEGWYVLTAIGANGCESKDSIEIMHEFIDPIVDATGDTITCSNVVGELNVETQETNLSYAWTGPGGEPYTGDNIQVVNSGMYIVTVTNDLMCQTLDTTFLLVDTLPPILMPTESEMLDCDTQSASLSINADRPITEYNWQGPNLNTDIANPIIFEGGIYLVTVTADNDCSASTVFEVIQDELVPFITTEDMELNCFDSRVELNAPNTATSPSYLWDGPLGFSSDEVAPLVIEPGTYFITVTDANGCAAFDSIVVTPNLDPPNIIANDGNLPCNGDPLIISAFSEDPILEYRWLGIDPLVFTEIGQIVTVTEPGSYVLLGIGINGCISLDTIEISDAPVPPFFELEDQLLNCYNPELDVCALFLEDDMSFEWSDGNTVIGSDTCQFIDSPGEYFLTVTGTNGCTETQAVTVSIDTISPTAIISPAVEILCDKQEDNLDATASSTGNQYIYQWETVNGIIVEGETSLTPRINGIGLYSLEVADLNNGCTSVTAIDVEESISSLSNINLSAIDPSCLGYENGLIDINSVTGGVPPYEFSLDGEVYSDKLQWDFLEPNLYTLHVRDAIGCIFMQDVPIGFGTDISVSLGDDQTVNLGDSIYIQGLTNIDTAQIVSINWNPGEQFPCGDCLEFYFTPLESVSFELVIQDENGCIGSDIMNVYVDGLPEVYVPNIFSPNGDNINDEIIIYSGVGIERILDWRIIDRWGNLLHHAEDFQPGDFNFAWDGNFRGEPVNPNVFVFIAEVLYVNGDTELIKGSITLLR